MKNITIFKLVRLIGAIIMFMGFILAIYLGNTYLNLLAALGIITMHTAAHFINNHYKK